MRVLFVTEAARSTGFGHIYRCIALSEAFKENGINSQFLIFSEAKTKRIFSKEGFIFLNWQKDKKLLEIIKRFEIVVLDSYLAGGTLRRKICKFAKLPVFIDDYKTFHYQRGIVLDWTINAEKEQPAYNKKMIFLLGAKFACLRKDFWGVRLKNTRSSLESILIAFGGSDLKGLTSKILAVVSHNFPQLHKKVIIGPLFGDIPEIKKAADSNTELLFFPDERKLIKAIAGSDAAICAGGQTLYELSRMGLPVISVLANPDQTRDIKCFLKKGFLDYAGPWNKKLTFKRVLFYLTKLCSYRLRLEKSGIGKSLIDGQGARRASAAILDVYRRRYVK